MTQGPASVMDSEPQPSESCPPRPAAAAAPASDRDGPEPEIITDVESGSQYKHFTD
jgi:hypothetical protein